jgi:hypothetical protein
MEKADVLNLENREGTDVVRQMPDTFGLDLEEEIDIAGGEWQESEVFEGAVGRTMFDAPSSKDNTVTVLLPPGQIGPDRQGTLSIPCEDQESPQREWWGWSTVLGGRRRRTVC